MYDAIVVGARCAGSPVAMLLARRGWRVLLVDRATFPSDMPMSTHLIWQSRVAQLERWGLLDKVRATNCPPLVQVSVDLGAFTLTGSPLPANGVDAPHIARAERYSTRSSSMRPRRRAPSSAKGSRSATSSPTTGVSPGSVAKPERPRR
jgi:2-polyprenyl-6-methoxyphenol hydroxylase-like FAD-dependent oxidoreductase